MQLSEMKKPLIVGGESKGAYYSLPALADAGFGGINRLPVSLRIVLESVLRHCGGGAVNETHLRALAEWQPQGKRESEVPFTVGRVVLQDFTGVPLLADLAAMRDAAHDNNMPPETIEPRVPVDLVVDHSVQVDHHGNNDAMRLNMEIEFSRNRERYEFLKWGAAAFGAFKVVPPGVGIVHQVNLENLARGVMEKDGVFFPDSLVGTDSHTTMINGVGVVGWGVGGIEAEAAMLGQPVYMLAPDVIGVCLRGSLRAGVTATDLVLTITEMLRAEGVVGKFVEFFGEGARALSVPNRATIANMAPEYGATMGFFATDEKTLDYFRNTGRSEEQLSLIEAYYKAQGLWDTECDYSRVVTLDLSSVVPSVAGPKRPQDRIALTELKSAFAAAYQNKESGYGKDITDLPKRYPAGKEGEDIGDGDILIAAITSCTNTSNPSVILAAGLLAKAAAARGLTPPKRVKTSLAPGSRVVSDYLRNAGLLPHLESLGFHHVGYGCTTCIGNSGPLDADYEKAMIDNNIIGVSVLSGNRNFEARVHQSIKANFLMSPPLVVAFALAGNIHIDMESDPLGFDKDNKPVFLRELWPSEDEIAAVMGYALNPDNYIKRYAKGGGGGLWDAIDGGSDKRYQWREDSTYIRMPPFLQMPAAGGDIHNARMLAMLGDSVTTDHISPAGAIKPSSPAGRYLKESGVSVRDYNSYGARRGNHEVMMRGTFANVRIRNLMAPGSEGGVSIHHPSGEQLPIYDTAMRYADDGVPLIVIAGGEYGTGSSRDWAAKGTRLLGVRAVIATSFERIHRSNLIGMGVLPCQFADGENARSLNLRGDEKFDLTGISGNIKPQQQAKLTITRADGTIDTTMVVVRIDTPTESTYYAKNGILPFVLEQLAA